MSKPVGSDIAIVLAGYRSVEDATEDWKALKKAKADEDVRMYDLAVVTKNADGSVEVVKDLHHKVRKGLVAGGVLALLTPVGLAVGLVGGAAAGKIASHFHKGVAKKDIEGLGELIDRHGVLLVALTDRLFVGSVEDALHSDDVLVESTTTTKAEFDDLLLEFESEG